MAAAPLSDDGPPGHDWIAWKGNTWEHMPQDLADPGAYAFLISAMGHKKHDWETAAAGARGPSPVKECSKCLTRMWSPASPGRGFHGWDKMTCEELQVAYVVES